VPYDLFVSYSRKDNQQGQITALREQIEADYLAFAGEDLRCFFDLDAIASMDDWRHRILQGLSESSILLLVLSPAYLDSPYCEWEIVEFLKYEHARSVGGQGVSPVYFVEIPGLNDPDFEVRAASWVARVGRRNRVDLRPWFTEGRGALQRLDVRTRLEELKLSLHDRLTRLRRLRNAPGNLPAHNPRFVGRDAEMERLHESVALGRFGVLTTVQGVGGLGKSALAIQYACAYAHFYPGGRWIVGCAGQTSLAAALRGLDLDLKITFDESEKRDDVKAARRVLAELERRAEEGARARAGEKQPPEPRTLLLLDNVDSGALLQPPDSELISGRPWLRVLATTRLGADELGGDEGSRSLLTIDELPDPDALRLIESYQPEGRFCNDQERTAALGLVRLLGGFTLAVEVVALHLGERAGRVTCAAFLARMEKEGLGRLDDGVGQQTKGGLRHGEKLLGPTLQPTLDLLSEPERRVLGYAALLPPDTIPVPWLRALVAVDYPELARDAEPGYEDPWLAVVNHLLGLRLLQMLDLDPATRTPRLVRMHRVVQEVVRTGVPTNLSVMEDRLTPLVDNRARGLKDDGWIDPKSRWEIGPLQAIAGSWLTARPHEGAILTNCIVPVLQHLGQFEEAGSLSARAVEVCERVFGRDHLETLTAKLAVARGLSRRGRYQAAGRLFQEVGEGRGRLLGNKHPDTLSVLHDIAVLHFRMGEFKSSLQLFQSVIEARREVLGNADAQTLASEHACARVMAASGNLREAERRFAAAAAGLELVLGHYHPETMSAENNWARCLDDAGELERAEGLYRAIADRRATVLGSEHPDTLASLNSLAGVLGRRGEAERAVELYRHVLSVRERVLGSNYPDVISTLLNLASVLSHTGRLDEAQPLYERAVVAFEGTLGAESDEKADAIAGLADVTERLGDYSSAEGLWRRVVEVSERVLGRAHPAMLQALLRLGQLKSSLNQPTEAEGLLRSALGLAERACGHEHPITVGCASVLARHLQRQGQAAEAASLWKRVSKASERHESLRRSD